MNWLAAVMSRDSSASSAVVTSGGDRYAFTLASVVRSPVAMDHSFFSERERRQSASHPCVDAVDMLNSPRAATAPRSFGGILMHRVLLLCALGALVVARDARADTGFYVRGDLGMAIGTQSNETDTNPNAPNASLGTTIIK